MLRARIKNSIRSFQKLGGGFVGLLDTYGGAAAAYSVRRLSSTYSGALIEVRRSSDNTTQDIGYDANGDLDTAALLSFVGAGNGFVRTWYDQSGNGNNAQQTTTTQQPQIVSSGVINSQNSLPTLSFNTHNLKLSSNLSNIATDVSLFSVNNCSGVGLGHYIMDVQTGRLIFNRGIFGAYFNGVWRNTTIGTGNSLQSFILKNSGGNVYYDSAITGASPSNYTQLNLGGNIRIGSNNSASASYFEGGIQEIIIYNNDKSSNRTGIESNINSYFSIY